MFVTFYWMYMKKKILEDNFGTIHIVVRIIMSKNRTNKIAREMR